jgi:hypothetical protein
MVARFFLVQQIKTGKNIPNDDKNTKLPKHKPNDCKIDHIAIKYANIFHYKALHNLPKVEFLVRKYTIWQH